MSLSRSLVYMRKSRGPRTLLCGTPDVTGPAAEGLVDANHLAPSCKPVPDQLGCTTLDAMCHDIYEKPFMWNLVKLLLKVHVDEVHCFVVTRVVGVNDTGKEVKQAC